MEARGGVGGEERERERPHPEEDGEAREPHAHHQEGAEGLPVAALAVEEREGAAGTRDKISRERWEDNERRERCVRVGDGFVGKLGCTGGRGGVWIR